MRVGCSTTRRSGGRLFIAGTLKAAYDLLLLAMFRNVRPPEESEPAKRAMGYRGPRW
jgi:hypothetical protein